MNELKSIINDLRTGALPIGELPGFIIYQVSRPAAIACIGLVIVASVIIGGTLIH